MEEIWKDIQGYEGLYKISNLGKVLRIKDNKLIGYYLNNKGYCCLSLYKEGKTYHPDFNFTKTKYKDLPNIKLPSDIWNIFKDNTVLNTLIAEGRVSV